MAGSIHPVYLVLSSAATILLFAILKAGAHLYRVHKSPLKLLPGPPRKDFVRGNLGQISAKQDASAVLEEWAAQYGPTYRYSGTMGSNRLFTTDLKALSHILNHPDDFPKESLVQMLFSRMGGEGLLAVSGEQHRRQRRVMNPAFSPAHIRALTVVFNEKSQQLCDVLLAELTKNGDAKSNTLQINIMSWLSRMTLDVIGLAGFNYKIDSLARDGRTNELADAFERIFKVTTPRMVILFNVAQMYLPLIRRLPTARKKAGDQARAVISRIGQKLMAEARADGEKQSDTKNKDLLSLLIRSNMSPDVPPAQRLRDVEVLHQLPTFLIAGHETTSTATTWALFGLCQRLDVQSALRKELQGVMSASPTMEELNALPLLDAVVRETLRLYAPVPILQRQAARDVLIPLDTPFTDIHGVQHREIRLQAGDEVSVPILAIHRSKELWGSDADQFNPYRWNSEHERAQHIPGVWGNLLAFSGGTRNCIGYRFSLVEMKALLFALLRTFEFELAVPVSAVCPRYAAVVQRPMVRNNPQQGVQLPVIIKPVRET